MWFRWTLMRAHMGVKNVSSLVIVVVVVVVVAKIKTKKIDRDQRLR